jgi:hypothetical protein
MKPPLTAEAIAWTERQPVVGDPSLTRLRTVLMRTGLNPIQVTVEDHGETVEFYLLRTAGLVELNDDLMTRLLISVMRRSGFNVGFSEVAIVDMNESVVNGLTYTARLQQLFDIGPPPVEP